MRKPDYEGGSIVNLMTSIIEACNGKNPPYPPLRTTVLDGLNEARHVILLVIDGLGFEYLTQRGADSTLARHLQGPMDSVSPSTTASAITTFLTGVAPQQHGLTGWFMYFKELGSVIAPLPFRPRCGGPPLSSTGISVRSLMSTPPVFDRLDVKSVVVAPADIADSDFNRTLTGSASMRRFDSLDGMLGQMARAVRGERKRSYVYAYWPEFDSLSHEHGVASDAVATHFAELDAALSRFLDSISDSGTAVIITADHGFIDSSADRCIKLEDQPELCTGLRVPLCGESRFAYCYLEPGRGSRFVEGVTARFADAVDAVSSAELLGTGQFGLGLAHPRLHERIGDVTLVMRENYTVKDWVLGERRYTHIGFHGGVSDAEMRVPLIVVPC